MKALLVDYNGVVNHHGHLAPFTQQLSKIYNLNKEKIIEVFKKNSQLFDKDEISVKDFWINFCVLLKIDYKSEIINLFNQSANLNLEVIEYLQSLKNKVKIYLFSNLNYETANYVKQQIQLQQVFDQMFFSCEEKTRKPETKFFQIILKKINFTPRQSIFIDDNKEFIQVAGSLDIKNIHYKTLAQLKQKLSQLI